MAKDKRVEVCFDRADFKRLEEVARRDGKPVGAMIREAVAKYGGASWAERERALQDFLSIDTASILVRRRMSRKMILKGYDEDDARRYEAD